MRRALFLPRQERRLLQVTSAWALALAGCGCQQPPCFYYYGYGNPPCAPCAPAAAAPVSTQSSAVSDVPTQVIEGGTSAADGSARATTVQGSQKYPRVVVSEPAEPSRMSWRRADKDASLATTTVEGGLGDSSVNR
jgi:hypothetical protein